MRLKHGLRASVLLALAMFATGCCCEGPMDRLFHGCCLDGVGEKYPCNSCGEAYYGDWHSHAPSPEPCDCHGNWTGVPHGPCGSGCSSLNHHHRACKGCSTGCDECAEASHPTGPYVAGRRQLTPPIGCASCGH